MLIILLQKKRNQNIRADITLGVLSKVANLGVLNPKLSDILITLGN